MGIPNAIDLGNPIKVKANSKKQWDSIMRWTRYHSWRNQKNSLQYQKSRKNFHLSSSRCSTSILLQEQLVNAVIQIFGLKRKSKFLFLSNMLKSNLRNLITNLCRWNYLIIEINTQILYRITRIKMNENQTNRVDWESVDASSHAWKTYYEIMIFSKNFWV